MARGACSGTPYIPAIPNDFTFVLSYQTQIKKAYVQKLPITTHGQIQALSYMASTGLGSTCESFDLVQKVQLVSEFQGHITAQTYGLSWIELPVTVAPGY